MTQLNPVGRQLLAGLSEITQRNLAFTQSTDQETINVVGAGGTLTAAYEQLRNAAENAEEHLLLQNAVRRFYKRQFSTRDESLIARSGDELVVELTFAGYIPNNFITTQQVAEITRIAQGYYAAYTKLLDGRIVSLDVANRWIFDTLSHGASIIIDPRRRADVFVALAYAHFDTLLPDYLTQRKVDAKSDYRPLLVAAIHKALLKSDNATVRSALLDELGVTIDDIDKYVAENRRVDAIQKSSLSDVIYHFVDRQGAPLRVLKRMIENRPDLPEIIQKREVFLEDYEQQVIREYSGVVARINRAVMRSVVFLIITKFIVGIAIEVPYDIWAHGGIVWQPLLINLVFPPVYMIALRFTLNVPGYANTEALVSYVDAMMYGEGKVLRRRSVLDTQFSSVFSGVYAVFGFLVFGLVTWVLLNLGFSIVHIGIFFVFISAASFLGFRISRLVRDLEIVRSASNGLTFVRDLVYLPFVVVGRWMSDQYAQINIVALVLDMLIELPLKTVLRLIRQWGAFIDDRKDRI
ncbi:MAG: hypothetical protein ABI303_04420 [Candidatus Saccharimonas sp.]